MPRLLPERAPTEAIDVGGYRVPVHRHGCVVVGSGAAGLRAAVELHRRDGDVAIVSQSAWGGTSACSGSDKQTLHTANTADRGDDYKAMARAIGRRGDGRGYGLYRGRRLLARHGLAPVSRPAAPAGPARGTLRYQTDHDEVGRATSCGPRTSRLMVKVLADEAIRLGIPFYNHTTAVKILTEGDGRRAQGLRRSDDSAQAWHAGQPVRPGALPVPGPRTRGRRTGELYRDSVYPNGCFGSLGLALDVGIELINLTESQFGIGTRREGFPWNLSGTYVQALPHIYSVDDRGEEHHFLASYYRTTQELASNIFRKGYQWPFPATRMLDFGSSLLDLAIYRETQAGRRVFMDFNRNPLPVSGDAPFSLDGLDEDVRTYLGTAGATHQAPIDRLRHMNPPRDRALPPVQDRHCGRAAGVRRQQPAHERRDRRRHLGSEQPGGLLRGRRGRWHPRGHPSRRRGAERRPGIRHARRPSTSPPAAGRRRPPPATSAASRNPASPEVCAVLRPDSPLTVRSVRASVQDRMSDRAGMIRDAESVGEALAEARELNVDIRR